MGKNSHDILQRDSHRWIRGLEMFVNIPHIIMKPTTAEKYLAVNWSR